MTKLGGGTDVRVQVFDGRCRVELSELGLWRVGRGSNFWVWAILACMLTEKFGVVGDGVSDAACLWGLLVF